MQQKNVSFIQTVSLSETLDCTNANSIYYIVL